MPPKKVKQSDRFRCDRVEGERFHAPTDDVFRFNWWEIFCFPYILCSRVWDCCVSLCSGTNQCLVYWMMIQWVICKITKITTPDPILFPYYFYLFCQVILLTCFFIWIWYHFGYTIFIPYFQSVYEQMQDDTTPKPIGRKNITRHAFRRYCFRKSELFEGSFDTNEAVGLYESNMNIVLIVVEYFVHTLLNK